MHGTEGFVLQRDARAHVMPSRASDRTAGSAGPGVQHAHPAQEAAQMQAGLPQRALPHRYAGPSFVTCQDLHLLQQYMHTPVEDPCRKVTLSALTDGGGDHCGNAVRGH